MISDRNQLLQWQLPASEAFNSKYSDKNKVNMVNLFAIDVRGTS